jgi:hypothetical protein
MACYRDSFILFVWYSLCHVSYIVCVALCAVLSERGVLFCVRSASLYVVLW